MSYYNTQRPHRALGMATPDERFNAGLAGGQRPARPREPVSDRGSGQWVSRRVASNAVVSVSWQQISVGAVRAGEQCDVHVDGDLLRLWIGDQLVKTVARANTKEVRKKNASVPGGRT